MIIPIRCFSCAKVLGHMWEYYQEEVRRRRIANGENGRGPSSSDPPDRAVYFNANRAVKTVDGEIFDELGLTRACCRKHMLGHVDIQ
jgi:DNA-directed RNA polymerase subunit N (RpoN/RPB10)